MQEPKSVTDLLTYRLLRLSNSFGLYSSRFYRDKFGVTLPEWRVMSIIATGEPTSAREISRILATDKGWVGLTIESLRKRSYVSTVPDENDRRRTLVSLTDEGRGVHDEILTLARRRQRRLLSTLPPGMADTLTAGLELLQAEADRMLDELDASGVPPQPSK